ncbi:MAG: hypothetical protein IJ740_08170 [Ruminococcus sp.]|nr:hypothetical protein [Ruminococcus sp.]
MLDHYLLLKIILTYAALGITAIIVLYEAAMYIVGSIRLHRRGKPQKRRKANAPKKLSL